MTIISFPVEKINYSHDIKTFLDLGFKIIDDALEGFYLKLPEDWLATYQYHTPFEFSIVIKDNRRRIRAYASLYGSIANIELINRYTILNYKPWLSPHNSELRLIDNTTGNTLFSQNYFPKHHCFKDNNLLIITAYSKDTVRFEVAYKKLLDFCKENNIDLEENKTSVNW